MHNNPRACFFTDFSYGLFGFDTERQASNSSAQPMKGNRAISEMKIAEFENNVDLDEVAHNEPPHLDLSLLPSSL